jgi:hypothetical protein
METIANVVSTEVWRSGLERNRRSDTGSDNGGRQGPDAAVHGPGDDDRVG